jgi:hypothetical protein
MIRRKFLFFCLILILIISPGGIISKELTFSKYHQPQEVNNLLKSWKAEHPQLVKLISLGKSAGGNEILIIRIAAQLKNNPQPDSRPAVFVSANLEGSHLIGTEAALMLANKLITKYRVDKKITNLLEKRTVYVAPLLNPDAAQYFFLTPQYEKRTNNHPTDDDLDDLIDEDGPEDLNGDGLITLMRVKDPEGEWIPDSSDPRLMKKADPKKGESGIYKIYTEGLDNDGDGEYNEDPIGGVELNRNFPHDFEYHVRKAGMWPVSEKETIALVKFLISHPNIALILNFSTENTFLNLQQTGKAKAARDKVKVPKRFATFLGLEPDKEYSIKEIVEILKGMNIGGGIEITEELVAQFFGLGPAVNIDKQDMPYFEVLQKEYKEALKKAKIDYPEKRAKGVGKGSFAAYCYYQYGVWIFSSDLWKIPEPKKKAKKDELTVEKLKKMSSEEFLSLEDEKIDAFLNEIGAPPNFKASMIRKMVESGRITPAKMAEMIEKMPKAKKGGEEEKHPDLYVLKWSDSVLKGKGFVPWKPYNHPTLGEVEIGGFAPYIKINPPVEEIEKTISFHCDFYLNIMEKLAELKVKKTKVERIEKDLYRITVYFTNPGWFPTSPAQGRRAGTSWPIRVELKTSKDQKLFSGKPIEIIPFIGGSGDTKKLEWLIRGKEGSKISIIAKSPKIGSVSTTIVLK